MAWCTLAGERVGATFLARARSCSIATESSAGSPSPGMSRYAPIRTMSCVPSAECPDMEGSGGPAEGAPVRSKGREASAERPDVHGLCEPGFEGLRDALADILTTGAEVGAALAVSID